MGAKMLLSWLLFLSTINLNPSIVWNNGIGKKDITAIKTCYIKIVNNTVEAWDNEGGLYWKTVIINLKEYVCRIPPHHVKNTI